MKKNQAQKFIVLFLFFLFAYSWRVEAQTGKEKQITMEFKNEGLPSIFKRFEKVSGYKVLFIYDEISSYTSTGKVEKATVGKSSVSCPLKPSDSAPLKHSTMPP